MAIFSRFACIALFALTCVTAKAAKAQQAKPTDGVLAFMFNGIPLGTSIADFQRRLPTASIITGESDDRPHIRSYIAVEPKGADAARFSFLNHRLYRIEILYYWPRINSLGGIEAFVDRICRQFGLADDVQQAKGTGWLRWKRPESFRRAEFTITESAAILAVTDTKAEAVVNQHKAAAADIGF